MVDDLSTRNLVIRDALAIAARDPAAAVAMLDTALQGAAGESEKATIAKHAGVICQATGELRRAAEFYRQAAAADRGDAYVHLALGQLYAELDQIEDARTTLNLCLVAARNSDDQELLDAATRAIGQLSTRTP